VGSVTADCNEKRRQSQGFRLDRPTLEQFLRYTHEQGIAHRHAKPEEILAKGTMTSVKV
jgi:serine/threonine protein kinase